MKRKAISCGIVGSGDLSVQCAEALINCGHRVEWVMPRGHHLEQWAKKNNVPQFFRLSAIQAAGIRIDYLFSILNDLILNKDFLALPSQCAINYHNSLLPAYAGVFATSWAILNGETRHGITWHVMDTGIDSGGIITQCEIPIGLNDTAYTVNQACKTQAFILFTALVGKLAFSGRLAPHPQPTKGRSYYSLSKKPPGAGLIIWEEPAALLALRARALTRGDIDNSFELLKFLFKDSFMIVEGISAADPGLTIAKEVSTALPGTILGCGKGGILVATGTAPVRISSLRYPHGERIEPLEWMRRSGLIISDRLACPNRSMALSLQETCESIAAHEVYCATAWSGFCDDVAIVPLKENLAENPAEVLSDYIDVGLVMMAFILSMANGQNGGAVLVSSFHLRRQCLGLEPFFSTALPLFFNCDEKEKVTDAEQRLLYQVARVVRNGLHTKDLLIRKKINPPATIPLIVDFKRNEPMGGCIPNAILLELRPGKADFRVYSGQPFGDEARLNDIVSANLKMLRREKTACIKDIPFRQLTP